MSHDLYFFKRRDNPITLNSIEEYLLGQKHFAKENDSLWLYENEDTGAYCTFELASCLDVIDENDKGQLNGFEEIGFGVNINYIRPEFFGLECFPIVEKLAKDFDLYIYSPQAGEGPLKYSDGELLEEWSKSNEQFCKLHFQEWKLSYLEKDYSKYTWEHNKGRAELQERLGDNYFVPQIFYIKKFDSADIVTLSVWPEHIPFVLPKVDFILIQRTVKKLFFSKKESGLITREQLEKELGHHFEDKGNYKIIHPKEASQISKKFNNLELSGILEDFGERIGADHFVNVRD